MKIFKRNCIMAVHLITSILLLVCCSNSSEKPLSLDYLQQSSNKDSALTKFDDNNDVLIDSTLLIKELYRGFELFPEKENSGFSYTTNFSPEDNFIEIRSSNKIEGNRIAYHILLKDTAGLYPKNEFSIHDYSYQYLDSYFKIGKKKVSLKDNMLYNADKLKVMPSEIWYEKDFGISTKYYKIGKREFFLIFGLDPYCNGRQCTSHQLFVIQKKRKKITVNVFEFSWLYPYYFENLHLFDEDGDGNPEMFVPKDVGELRATEDFEKFELEFSSPVKWNRF